LAWHQREKLILIASVRMTIQLMLMGWWLLYIFENPKWWLSSLMLLIMLSFATANVYKRVPYIMSGKMKILVPPPLRWQPCISVAVL
jgi:putative ABC transport system permease protein